MNTQMEGELLLSEFAEIVKSGLDAEVSYQLAESYNMLLATHIAVLQMKEEVTPGYPATLTFYETQLALGMQTNYTLIGSEEQACAPSYLPTQGRYYVGVRNGVLGGLQVSRPRSWWVVCRSSSRTATPLGTRASSRPSKRASTPQSA